MLPVLLPKKAPVMMKRALIAAALVAGSLSAAAAMQTQFDLGTLNPNPAAAVINVAGSFTDYVDFTVADPYTQVGGSLTNTFVDVSAGGFTFNVFGVANLAGAVYEGLDGNGTLLPGSAFANVVNTTYLDGVLQPGHYYVQLTGTATGSNGGLLTVTGVAQAIPEPGEGALMLSGLGLVGLLVRRRRQA